MKKDAHLCVLSSQILEKNGKKLIFALPFLLGCDMLLLTYEKGWLGWS